MAKKKNKTIVETHFDPDSGKNELALVSYALDRGLKGTDSTYKGLRRNGVPIGDWQIIVRQVKGAKK
jgi:hypothetical protein